MNFIKLCMMLMIFCLGLVKLQAETGALVLKIDIIESDKQPTKYFVLDNIDKLYRRNTGLAVKYVTGAEIGLQESIKEQFKAKSKDADFGGTAGYTKLSDTRFKIFYDAGLSFPGQDEPIVFANSMAMDYNEVLITEKSKRVDGTSDTRPYWAVIRVVKKEAEYVDQAVGTIGAVINYKDGYPYILDIVPYSPAEKEGLKGGDVVMEIDGVDMFSKSLQEAIDKIRGIPGTRVKLKIKCFDTKEMRTVEIERRIIR